MIAKQSHVRRVRRAGVLVIAVAAVLAGCSGGGGDDGAADTTAASTVATTTPPVDTLAPPTVVNDAVTTVLSIDNDYEPKHLQVTAGTEVEFKNIGRNKHNIVPNDPSLGVDFAVSEEDFPTGSSFTATFSEPGTYAYYCTLHATPTAGSMRGVITVTE